MKHISNYTEYLVDLVYDRIDDFFSFNSIDDIIQNNIIIPHIDNKNMLSYHKYYFKVVENKKYYLKKENFFQEFVQKNKIKGLSDEFCTRFENDKEQISRYIKNGDILPFYIGYFLFSDVDKSLFTKLAHIFLPHYYCMLDNRIISFFQLEKESFYIAFNVICDAYRSWWQENLNISLELAERVNELPVFNENESTKMKILDMIFYAESRKIR